MKYLFIDESGDHNLEKTKMDPKFPFFVLTGIVFESKEYQKFKIKLLKLKKKLFKSKKIILHSKELTHPVRTNQKELRALTEPSIRKNFYNELNLLIQNSTFETLVYTIDKKRFNKTFKSASIDIYFLSFANIFKKFEPLLK